MRATFNVFKLLTYSVSVIMCHRGDRMRIMKIMFAFKYID